VRECTFYEDKRLATKDDLVEIAWHLRTPGKPSRDMGFAASDVARSSSGESVEE
jgi:hypothetical protein